MRHSRGARAVCSLAHRTYVVGMKCLAHRMYQHTYLMESDNERRLARRVQRWHRRAENETKREQRREADRQRQRALRQQESDVCQKWLVDMRRTAAILIWLLHTDLRTSHLRSPAPAARLPFTASPLVLHFGGHQSLVAGALAAFVGQPLVAAPSESRSLLDGRGVIPECLLQSHSNYTCFPRGSSACITYAPKFTWGYSGNHGGSEGWCPRRISPRTTR